MPLHYAGTEKFVDQRVGEPLRRQLEEQGVEIAVDAHAVDIIGHAGERQPAAVEQRERQQRLERMPGDAQRIRLERREPLERPVEGGADVGERFASFGRMVAPS